MQLIYKSIKSSEINQEESVLGYAIKQFIAIKLGFCHPRDHSFASIASLKPNLIN